MLKNDARMGFFLYIYPQLIIITSNLTNIMDANYQQFLKEIKGFMKEEHPCPVRR